MAVGSFSPCDGHTRALAARENQLDYIICARSREEFVCAAVRDLVVDAVVVGDRAPWIPAALKSQNGGQLSFYGGRKIIFTCSPYPGYT